MRERTRVRRRSLGAAVSIVGVLLMAFPGSSRGGIPASAQGVFGMSGSPLLAASQEISPSFDPAVPGEDRPVDGDRASSRNEVSVAAHPRDPDVVVAAMHDFAENQSQGPGVVTYRSEDGGATYRRTGVFPPFVNGVWTADPSIAFDSGGRAYVAFLQGVIQNSQGTYQGGGLFVARSDDGGQTWGEPRLAVRSISQGVCAGPDKPFLGIGPGRSRGSEALYLSWQEHQSSDPDACEDVSAGTIVKVARSTDGGLSFSKAVALSKLEESAFGSMPRVTKDGVVRISFLVPGGSGCPQNPNFSLQMVVATSRDQGRSFVRSVAGETCSVSLASNGAALGANSIPILDISPSGKLAMIWSAGESDADNRLEAVISDNGGRTWERLPDLGSGPVVATLQAWPAFGPDERLHVMYLGSLPGGLYDAYVTSFSGGAWSEPMKLTSQPSVGTGVNAGFGLGHYQGFDVGVDGTGHAMWTDARKAPAMYTVDVWTRSIPLER